MAKIIETWDQVIAEDNERKRNRLAYNDGEYITILCGSSWTYDIGLSRLRTPGQALDWIHQISCKTWTWDRPQIMRDFIEVLYETIPTSWWAGK